MGKWKETINCGAAWRGKMTLDEQHRDKLVEILNSSNWAKESGKAEGLIDELSYAEGAAEMDDILEQIYDLADEDRIWLERL